MGHISVYLQEHINYHLHYILFTFVIFYLQERIGKGEFRRQKNGTYLFRKIIPTENRSLYQVRTLPGDFKSESLIKPRICFG